MLAGDFSARTGELYDFIMTDSTEFVPELCDNPSYDTDDFNMPRGNVDKKINNYGRDLISFCQSYGMHIVNGRVTGDKRGNIIFLLTGLRIYTGEYKAQGLTLCPTEGRALRRPRALDSPV